MARTRAGTAGRPRAPEGRALQFEDLDPEGQGVVARNMRKQGMIKSRLSAARAVTVATSEREENNPLTRHKARRAVEKLDTMIPHVHDEPVSIARAARRRVGLFQDAASRAAEEGRASPRGTGWYFDHRADLNETARKHGMDEQTIVTASAVMSPSNSPDNEKKAVDALAHAHSTNPRLSFSKKMSRQLGRTEANFHDLTPDEVATISAAKNRGHTEGDIDLVGISAGGTRVNIKKAVNVLRGNTPLDKAIDPHSSPKVWSYHNAISLAGEGLKHPEIMDEYKMRVHEAATGQGTLDLHSLRSSAAGILNPQQHTAEDTWMHSMTMGQPFTSEGRMSVGKEAGSNKALVKLGKTDEVRGVRRTATPDARIGDAALMHAYNNMATRTAAESLSGPTSALPSIAAQEITWTEGRIQASKDPAFKREKKAEAAAQPTGGELAGQGSMFTSTGNVRPEAKPPNASRHLGAQFS